MAVDAHVLTGQMGLFRDSAAADGGCEIEWAWRLCGDLFCTATTRPTSLSQADIEREILFCLLGGFGISFEHGRSAAEKLVPLTPFAEGREDDDLFDVVYSALSRDQFEPPRRDGSFRRYRFPKRKASLIVGARRWLLDHAPLHELVRDLPNGPERRRFLCGCPGVGMKTASWLLRNLGWDGQLAILDVHILRALKAAGRVSEDISMPRDYETAEAAFLGWCHELGAPPSAFDLFLWEWQRGTLLAT